MATAVLFSSEYETNKALLLEGLAVLESMIGDVRREHEQTQTWWTILSPSLVLLAFVSKCVLLVPVKMLNRRLKRLSRQADNAQLMYTFEVRRCMLTRAGSVVEAIDGSSMWTKGFQPVTSDHAPHMLLRRRLGALAMCVELVALGGFAIPATLTFVALYKAEAAVPVQQLTVHSKDIVFYDVALTSSARLCALSRDARWAEAYHNFTAPWTAASASLDHWDSDLAAEFATATSAATAALSSMELLALNACASESSRSAREGDVLFGADYEGNKSVRLDGIHSLKTAVSQRQQVFQSDDHSFNTASRVLVIISTFLIVVADFFAVAIAMWVESLTVSRAEDSQEPLGRPLKHFISSLIGCKRIIP